MDDYSRMKWSFFRKQKSEIGNVLDKFVEQLAGINYRTKFLRCDDAGENTKQLAAVCKRRGIKIEYTAPHTPQLNGVVERAFVTLRQRAMAMMFSAQFTDESQGRLWAEAVNTATMLTNQAINSVNQESPNDLFYGDTLPKLRRPYKDLKEFGRIGHVTIRTKVKKLDKKTIKCVFLGYSMDHSSGTYRMYNPDTNSIIDSRDVKWAAWHGSNDPRKSIKNLFTRAPVELPTDPAPENPEKHPYLEAPSPDNDEKSAVDHDSTSHNKRRRLRRCRQQNRRIYQANIGEEPHHPSTQPSMPTATPGTQPSNFGRKTDTRQDVNTRLVKAAKVAREMKKLETSYNSTPQLIESEPGIEEERPARMQGHHPKTHPPCKSTMCTMRALHRTPACLDPTRKPWRERTAKNGLPPLKRK